MGEGYKKGTFRLWTKVLEIQEGYILIKKDDDAYDFASFFSAMNIVGHLFMEHSQGGLDLDDLNLTVSMR